MRSSWLICFLILASCSSLQSRAPSNDDRPQLESAFASQIIQFSLRCVDQEEPHASQGQDPEPHSERFLHPAFYGCFDWHSAVHSHWTMLRAANLLPALPERNAIMETLGRHLTVENIDAELQFLEKKNSFEGPYGWAWYLRLAEELRISNLPQAKKWQIATAPLEKKIVRLMLRYLRKISQPNRTGLHSNTAYAMIHAWDYASPTQGNSLQLSLAQTARKLYFADRDCPLAAEPGPSDFLSPCFAEADLMRRVLGPAEFAEWFAAFLPNITAEQLKPISPADPKDYHQVHLVGLMYEKARELNGVATQLPGNAPLRKLLLASSAEQIRTANRLIFDTGYGGTHWLASFAVFYYTNNQ